MRNIIPVVFQFLLIFSVIVLSQDVFGAEFDLSLSINASDNFTLGKSNEYKIIVTNNDTAGEDINVTIDREIFNATDVIYSKSGNYSLKRSMTKTYQWTPGISGNYVLCANITFSAINDTNPQNDRMCKNIFVQAAQNDAAPQDNRTDANDENATEQRTNVTCNLEIKVTAEKYIYNSTEPLGIRISVSDLNYSGNEHAFRVGYWIEDLFGKIVKARYENTYKMGPSWTREYNPQAPKIIDSEAYTIKTELIDAGCNDTGPANNHDGTMILVKGGIDNETGAGDLSSRESYVRIAEINPGNAEFGDRIDVTVEAFRGDTSKYSVGLWMERPSDKEDVSEKTTMHLKTKNLEYKMKIPVQIKPNCNGKYKDGTYYLIAEGLDARDMMVVKISGISKELCKTETRTVTKYVLKKSETAPAIAKNSTKPGASKANDIEFAILPTEGNITIGKEFITVIEVKNRKSAAINISIYSYVISGMSRLSEGLGTEGWEKSWTGNKKEVLIDANDSVRVNLSNRIMQNVTGNFTLKVKISGSMNKVFERSVIIERPSMNDIIYQNYSLEVTCNSTGKKTQLFLKNGASDAVNVIVTAQGTSISKRSAIIKAGGTKSMTYKGRVGRFLVEYGGRAPVGCRPDSADNKNETGNDGNKAGYDVDFLENSMTLKQTSNHSEKSFIGELIDRILAFFERR